MTQWTVQIEPVAGSRYQWRHVPVQGDGDVHQGTEQYESAELARQAGEAALKAHHEAGVDAPRQTAETDIDKAEAGYDEAHRGRQAETAASGSSVSLSSLPLEAEVRAADEEGLPLTRH